MSKYFSIFLLVFLLMVVPNAYSQSKPDSLQLDSLGRKHKKTMRNEDGTLDAIGRYTPQSPQTASLLKYTEFPVSPAIGIPNIDIPIYTIEWDGVRIPISISYHASGIKVNDVASPVGLGWVLNAGGVIGCSKNGARDDFSSQTIKSASELKKLLQSTTIPANSFREIANGSGTIDTESDRYQYNFNGHNGCFRYDYTDMSIKTIPYEPIKIEELESGFKITDGDGTQYFFLKVEMVGGLGYGHRSACHLTSIVTPMKCDTITFSYDKTSVYYQTFASEYQHSGIYYDWDEENVGNNMPYVPISGPIAEYAINKTNVNYAVPLLTSIIWNGNRIEFTYNSDRPEYQLQRERLTQILVKNDLGNIINTVSLDNTGYLGTSLRGKRMLLKGITMNGAATGTNPVKYFFSYNMNALPDYMNINDLSTIRFHEDYWGYYNGTNSVHAVPTEYMADASIGGTDRTPDAQYAQHGILTSITYPTGGSSSFTYEGNVATGMCGGIRVKEISNTYQGEVLNREVFDYPDGGSQYLQISEDLFRYSTYYYYYREMHLHCSATEWDSDEHVVSQSSPILPLSGWSGTPVFYRNVNRSYYDKNGNLCGKTTSLYTDAMQNDNRCPGTDNYDYPRFYSELYNCDTGFPQPLLLSEVHYQFVEGKQSTISSTSYNYKKVVKDDFPVGVRVSKDDVEVVYFSNQAGDTYVPYPSRAEFVNSFHYHDVYAIPTFYILQSKSSINYEIGEQVTESYLYDSDYRSFKPTVVERECSDGKSLLTHYTYPFNASNLESTSMSTVNQMLSRHQIDIVLGEKIIKNNLCVSNKEYGHAFVNAKLQETSYSISREANALEKRFTYDSFDSNGNPRSLSQDNVRKFTIIWGYRHQLPVALIDGVSYTSLSSVYANITRVENALTPSVSDLQTIKQKVQSLGGMCTLYNYQPLVGITSREEPSGEKTYYSYDVLGRLSAVKDTQGKTIQSYSYYYNNGSASTHNYVQKRTMLDASSNNYIDDFSFTDGLGREISNATTGLGTKGNTAQGFTEYDGMHRAMRTWLPAILSSSIRNVALSDIESRAVNAYTDASPYMTYVYGSNLFSVSTTGPGEKWNTASHAKKRNVCLNAANVVKLYTATASSILLSGYYSANSLMEETITDEDGKQVKTFTDSQGRIVLKRQIGQGDYIDTYYVYNDLGDLRFVLSPSYQEEADMEKFAYEYRYDKRGRCVWKRVPGCEYQQLWYDNADNLMFSQDGEMRKKGVYIFYLYDEMGRQIVQGSTTAINASCPSAVAQYRGGNSGLFSSGYVTTNNLGLMNGQLYVVNYYDDHRFLDGQLVKQSTSQSLASTASDTKESFSKGMLTGTISRDTDGKFHVAAIYHNQEGLIVETRQTVQDDALLCQKTTYSFTKNPQTMVTQIKKSGVDKTITQKNRYNKYNDKIETITLNAGNGDKAVASYQYDDLGRLVSTKRSGNAGTITYEYNIRNWLVSNASDRFKESLKYESGSETPCYNGNISRMQWQNTNDNVLRGYDFEYDGLNRLTASAYAEGTDMSQNKDRYSEYIPQYSPNGSIERLQRYGKKNNGTFGLIDDLTYQYRGNQIQSISDKAGSLLYNGSFDFKDGASESTEYFYNANGALTKDLNKGISKIEYDVLDNLSCITFNNGFKTKYVYDAGGSKLRTIHEALTTNTTDYIGDFIFEDGKLSKYQFEGGYCSFDSNLAPTYHYYEKDHLGSIRMVVNENGTVEQVNHYYPFGGIYGDLTYNSELQRNKYIGKEFDHTSGLDWYDHGARMYDAAKGNWDRVDKLAEKYCSINPYIYSINNPITYLDLDGLRPRIYIETNGLGHTFVTIGEGRNTIVYTYGRYGALGSSGSILHQFTPTGEGVLVRKTGKQAREYLNEFSKKRNISIYTIEKGSDKDIASFFDEIWGSGTKTKSTTKKIKNNPDAKVVDEYNIFTNNCTTKSIEGVNYKQSNPLVPAEEITPMQDFGGSYNYKDKVISPSTLKHLLDKVSRKHPKDIVKVKNPQEFINQLFK